MHARTICSAAALCLACSAAQAQSKLAAAAPVAVKVTVAAASLPLFTEAMRLYRDGRFAAAYGRFIQLADAGDPDAARIALVMLRHGGQLHGTEWTATVSQVRAWERSSGASAPMEVVYLGE